MVGKCEKMVVHN